MLENEIKTQTLININRRNFLSLTSSDVQRAPAASVTAHNPKMAQQTQQRRCQCLRYIQLTNTTVHEGRLVHRQHRESLSYLSMLLSATPGRNDSNAETLQ